MVERGAVALAVPQPEQTVSFARATVTSEVDRQALLEIGGWPPIAIWVNDDLVWNQTAPHGYHPNTDRVAVTLKKGENRILLSGAVMAYVGIAEEEYRHSHGGRHASRR